MAAYPIEVRVVTPLGTDGAARDSEIYSRFGGSYEATSGQSQELLAVHETMTNLARTTGGRMYANRNDLHAAIGESIDSGSNYYNRSTVRRTTTGRHASAATPPRLSLI